MGLHLTTVDQRKYPEATDYAICSLIGGFFFLRFINPAIVTPQAYMLVDGVPAKHPRRTLTLVWFHRFDKPFVISTIFRLLKCCKISQISRRMQRRLTWLPSIPSSKITRPELINSSTTSAKLEISMTHWRLASLFVYSLCSYFFSQMDQYMALSKKDLMIHITLNELYNTHSLILQHIETLVCSSFFRPEIIWYTFFTVVTKWQATLAHPYRRVRTCTRSSSS